MSEASRPDAAYALDLCARIAACTEVPGTITRPFLSPSTHQVHAILRAEMQSLGMAVRTDSVGNLRGIYPAARHNLLSFRSEAEESASAFPPPAPTLLLGSHIDTVPDAGAYDGILGVTLPLALLRSLEGRRLPYAIELIAFSEEEGVRFGFPFIGSRALIGDLGPAELARTDAQGVSLTQAIRDFGLNPDTLTDAAITPGTFAFLEVHIEQGPVLEALNLPLGIVETIVGQSRFDLTFTGQANHAGTTPMHLRRDALAAAAAFILAAEAFAQATPSLVATVGVIRAQPGAANVIPGLATCSLDIRHADDALRLAATQHLLAEATLQASARNIQLHFVETSAHASVPMHPTLRAALASALEASGHTPHPMPSGAGHDAMILATRVPAAMLFLRSPGGISHHPSEAVLLADAQAALDACLYFLERQTGVL